MRQIGLLKIFTAGELVFGIKHRTLIPALVTSFLCCLSTGMAFAGPFDLPPLAGDDQKLAFLLEVKRQIPELFSDAAQYDIDLFTLLDNEQELIHKLKQYPEYQKLFAQKRYIDLTITPPKEGISVGAVEIKAEAIQAWKDHLGEQIKKLTSQGLAGVRRSDGSYDDSGTDGLQNPPQSPQELTARIQELQKSIHFSEDPNQIIQKIGKIPPLGRSKGEKAAFQAQVRVLRPKNNILFECQREKILLAKYECLQRHHAELVGLPHLPSIEELYFLIQTLKKQELFYAMLELYSVMNRTPEMSIPPSWVAFAEQVKNLGAEDLIHLDDREEALKPILTQAIGGAVSSRSSDLTLRTVEAVHKTIRSFASQTTTQQVKVTDPVKITEVLPEVAIFRGCTGGDCASQYSFPYPNDPHERVFFIQEMKTATAASEETSFKKLKGYVGATEVKLANGDSALYVITINGNKVNAGNAELILRGLEKEKDKLGVKHILIPSSANLATLINYPGVRGVYNSYAKKGKSEAIIYQDLPIRQAIETFTPESGYNQGTYDHHSKNQTGILFKPDRQSDRLVTTLVPHDLKGLQPQDLEHASTQELLEFILDLHHSNRNVLKNRILQIDSVKNKIEPKPFGLWLGLLDGCAEIGGKPNTVQIFKASLRSKIRDLGISESFVDEHPKFMYPGIIKCTDAYSKANIEETALEMVQDLRSNNYNAKGINLSSLPLEQKRELDATTAFQKIYHKLRLDLKNSNSEVRLVAASALSVIQPTDVKIHLALADVLKDQVLNARLIAAYTLGKTKPSDVKIHLALVEALKDKEGPVRLAVASALQSIKPTNVKVYLALAEVLKDPNANVRRTAGQTLRVITGFSSRNKQAQISHCLEGAAGIPFSDEKIRELQEILENRVE
jgi:hypothetical protein